MKEFLSVFFWTRAGVPMREEALIESVHFPEWTRAES